MLNSTLRRSAVVTGTIVATSALALSAAATAGAAPAGHATKLIQASATSAKVSLGGQSFATPTVTATNDGSQDSVRVDGTTGFPQPPQSLLSAGAFGTIAVANPNSLSYACAGALEPGGTLSIGTTGKECFGEGGPRRGGLVLDLSSVTSALPIGIGSVKLSTNGVTAFSRTEKSGAQSGFAKIDNLRLQVCAGLVVNGGCVGQFVEIPVKIKGGANEDLLPALLQSLTKNAQLGALGQVLATALKPVLSIETNVQNKSGGALKVTGLQLKVAGGAVAALNLSVATSGPNGKVTA